MRRGGKDDKFETNVGKERVCTENKLLYIKRESAHTDNIMMSVYDKRVSYHDEIFTV